MRHCSRSLFLLFVSAAICAPAGAQKLTNPALAPETPALKLAYRFRPGTATRLRYSTSGTVILDISPISSAIGGGIVPDAIIADVTAQYTVLQRVKNVAPDGSATLLSSLESMSFRAELADDEVMVAKLQNGRLTFTRDGNPFSPPGLRGKNPFAGKTFESRVSPTGQLLEQKGSLYATLFQLFTQPDELKSFQIALMMPEVEILVLPVDPASVGQSWEEPESIQALATSVGSPRGTSPPGTALKSRNTLTALQQRGSRRIAVITTGLQPAGGDPHPGEEGGGTVTLTRPDGVGTIEIRAGGTHLFDITEGALRMTELNVRITGRARIDRPGQGTVDTRTVDATLVAKLNAQPVAAASTPARRPAALRRRRW